MVVERQRPGTLEVICGPMFSGKSEELIRRLRRARIARQRIQAFKPALDDRYDAVAIASHAESRFEALPVADSGELARHLAPEVEVVAIDEVQFFDEGLLDLVERMADGGIRVILAGLDLDSEGRPFGIMPQILARAEHVLKLQAICIECGAGASRTYRKVRSGGQVLVGAADLYEARCRHCHREVDGSQVTLGTTLEGRG
ncbi:MAG TPA: thymidine kinase [Holophagaceae bacterium]|nr:thymidine kinase [Holophagaceae bacterium]